MTAKLLPQTSFPFAKGKDWSKGHKDSGISGVLADCAGNDHVEHSPSTRERQGELHGTFCTKASLDSGGLLLHTHHSATGSPRVSDVSCGWDPKALGTFETEEDSPCSEGLKPIS